MAECILMKAGGGADSGECTAMKSQVLEGKTAVTKDSGDEPAAGTMPNKGAWTSRIGVNGKVSVPAGYHNGQGYVDQQITVTAGSGDVLKGKKTITNDSNNAVIEGTMPDRGSWSSGELAAGASVVIPAGRHSGAGKVTAKSLAAQTGGATAADGYVLSGKTYWKDGALRTGTMGVSSVVSFSAAPYSTSQVLCSWKNPAKGPYGGFIIRYKTGGYPASVTDGAGWQGAGNNTALGAANSVVIGGLTAGTAYYFRIWAYCQTTTAGMLYSGYQQAAATVTAHGRKAFTASETFVVPAGVRSVDIHCTGGGGGGGGTATGSTYRYGGGGAGGKTAYKMSIAVTPGQAIAVTVGAGGSSEHTLTGRNGGLSSAVSNGSSLCAAEGGTGGSSKENTSDMYGGSGGSGGGGYLGNGGFNGSNGYESGSGKTFGTGQAATTKEFGTGTLYSGGGGAGGYDTWTHPNNDDSGHGEQKYYRAYGGQGGGGAGAIMMHDVKSGYHHYFYVVSHGVAGSAGTGGGGGGSSSVNYYSRDAKQYANGGAGGTGNVIIRW